MYDGYEKPRQICVVATNSKGKHSIRISYNNYTHAVIYTDREWAGQAHATFHRRKDLAERKMREMNKFFLESGQTVSLEVVATKEVRVSEGRKLKRLLKLQAIQKEIEALQNTEVVSG
jgi:uncharacterized protein YukE